MQVRDIDRLKREAKKMSRSEGITHYEALDKLANRHGFLKWSLLMKSFNRDSKETAK